MREKILTLIVALGLCLPLAATFMCINKKNGDVIFAYVDDVESVTFHEELSIVDESYSSLTFGFLTDSTVEVSGPGAKPIQAPTPYNDEKTAIIPQKVRIKEKVYTVTSIREMGFIKREIMSVSIPSGVQTIGKFAFHGCSELINVKMSSGVIIIGNYAFQYCSKLTSISIPSTVDSVGVCAFQYCSSLKNIDIEDGVKSIGDYAFQYCDSLETLDIPASVDSIGGSPFAYCGRLKSINVDPENPYFSSEKGVLFNKDKTTLICVPGGFSGDYEIPSTVTSIKDEALGGCESLTSLVVPSSVKYFAIDHIFGEKTIDVEIIRR